MKYAVIDIGSNTMRTVIYEVINDDFEIVISEKEFAELISYIEDNLLTCLLYTSPSPRDRG